MRRRYGGGVEFGRRHALAGIVGPVSFVSAWVVSGLLTGREYSPIDDAISRLAAVGADTRVLMSAGFIVFGVSLPLFGQVVRNSIDGPAWIAATLTGLATLGVAATPLDWSAGIDRLHGVFAGFGYITLALTPLLAARPLFRSGQPMLAGAGLVAGAVSSVALGLTLSDLPSGLTQRTGLTATDAWIVALAATLLKRRPARL